MGKSYDFSGWATRNDLKCSDGRIIRRDAFKHNDGTTVPLVWNHDHVDPFRIVGHALLENRDEGVYAYCSFNDTELGRQSKIYVEHGDITQLSIYANQLKQEGPNVMHGCIREVSLVMAGANPGAYIEEVMMHGEESSDMVRIFTGLDVELYHSDEEEIEEPEVISEEEEKPEKGDEKVSEENKIIEHAEEAKEETVADVFNTLNEKQKTVVYAMIGQALEEAGVGVEEDEDVKHSYDEDDEIEHAEEETVADVFNTLNEKQKTVVYAMIGQALEEAGVDIEDEEESEGGKQTMKHNAFDVEGRYEETEVLSHSEMMAVMDEARKCGSFKTAALEHGITDIEEMFPDNKALNAEPGFVKRDTTWVDEVLNGVHHTPFARIKSIFADLRAEEARARGYVKGKMKIEEVIKMLKRITNPTTIYKKQAIDRDDVLDITDFNLIAWLWKEIKIMWNEELARAILIGDGRDPVTDADNKINEECIRPIWTDEELYTVRVAVEVSESMTAEDKAKAFIKACVKSRKDYKGTGSPAMYMGEDMLTDCLLIEDKNGRVIYDTVEKLAAALRVKRIVPVPVMENLTRTKDDVTYTLGGIYVNLIDYNIGTDKGGEMTKFEDFDIDYNKHKYLLEGRCSGALVKPFAAVAIEFVPESSQG